MKPLATFVSGVAAAFFFLASPLHAKTVKTAPVVKQNLTTTMVTLSNKPLVKFEGQLMAKRTPTNKDHAKAERPKAERAPDPNRLFSDVRLPDYTKQDYTKANTIPPEYLSGIMQAAAALEQPLGEFLSTAQVESAGTWNPYVRPPLKGTDAKGRETRYLGSATGLYQFMPDTFHGVLTKKNTEDLLSRTKKINLGDETFTDEQVRALLRAHSNNPGSQRNNPEFQALRSNVIVSTFAKHYLNLDSGGENAAARYCSHVTGNTVAYRRGADPAYKDQLAAPDFPGIAPTNPSIFGPPDKPLTYAGVRQRIESLSDSGIGVGIARRSLGVGYDERPTAASKSGADLKRETTGFFATSGEEVRLPKSFVYQGLSKEEQATYRERFAHEALRGGYNRGQSQLDPAETTWLMASLKRQGLLPQDSAARDFNDPRVKQALSAFQEKVGIVVPPESRGLLMPATKVALSIYNERIDTLAGRQLEQQRGLKAPGVLDLKRLAKLEKNDSERQAAEPQIKELKEALASKGLLARPFHTETQVTQNNKGRQIKRKVRVEDDFDGQIDNKLLLAYETAQIKNGLLANGKLDQVSLRVIQGQAVTPTAKPAVAASPPPASPAAAMAVVARPAPASTPAPAPERAPAPTPAPASTKPVRRPAAARGRPGPVAEFNPAAHHEGDVSVSLAALRTALEAPAPVKAEPVAFTPAESSHPASVAARPAERPEPG